MAEHQADKYKLKNDKEMMEMWNMAAMDHGYEAMKWYGWGSAVGLGIFFALLLSSVGFFLWLLHVSGIIG